MLQAIASVGGGLGLEGGLGKDEDRRGGGGSEGIGGKERRSNRRGEEMRGEKTK